jgi:protein-tyrosine phosphatase
MTRAHRRRVLELAPRALARTFTLREAAGLVELPGADVAAPGEGLADRARALVREMTATRSRRPAGSTDDIADPIGQPVEVHEAVGAAVAEALIPLLACIAGLHRPVAANGAPTPPDFFSARRQRGTSGSACASNSPAFGPSESLRR